jgi:hypothetical protein
MSETRSQSSVPVGKLITIPAVITLAITVLRLFGELQHWPRPWFDSSAGGGGAIVGISWLPILFGPYFAWKLAAAGEGPAGLGKSFGAAIAAVVVFVAGGLLIGATAAHPGILTLLASLITLAAAFVVRMGWRAFGNALLTYAVAARIPVLIVMFIAMSANGGQGWGTHYDVVPSAFVSAPFWRRFVFFALVPQATLWIGWTVAVGALFGNIVLAIFRPGKRAATAAA